MSRDEKIFLLAKILESIRGNWSWGIEERLDRALELANELELYDVVMEIDSFYLLEDMDGRYFRDCRYGYNFLYAITETNFDSMGNELREEVDGLKRNYF